MEKKIFVYDTTLRDGAQGENVSFSVQDKLRVARKLDELGVHYIEGGWPGSNEKDAEFFRLAADRSWQTAKLVAFGSTALAKNQPSEDPNLQALLAARTPVVTIFGKTWDFHVHAALRIPLTRNCELIRASVAHLKSQGREVIFDAEHFFDGFAANADYALQTLKAAADGGADLISLCDTNGDPSFAHQGSHRPGPGDGPAPLGIHCHNDSELAIANTIAAVECGVVQVQGTMNGYGERCGNANLCSIIPNLELKMGFGRHRGGSAPAAHQRFPVRQPDRQPAEPQGPPFVGESAFAHKGGVHVSAVIRDAATYEHILPEMVGNERRILVSELSGRSNLLFKAREMNLDIAEHEEKLKLALQQIKKLENQGYEFEAAEGSVRVLLETAINGEREFFRVDYFRVVTDMHRTGEVICEATVKARVGDKSVHTVAEGDGPVHALDKALRLALNQFFEPLRSVTLIDYKVRVLTGSHGTASRVRVHIQQTDGEEIWTTVGVSVNILEASYIALADGIRYKLLKTLA